MPYKQDLYLGIIPLRPLCQIFQTKAVSGHAEKSSLIPKPLG